MNRTPVTSSNVVSIGYDPSTLTLEVEFKGNSVYQYFDVPEVVYQELMRARSIGQFMHANIRNNYRYAKV
ncbi:KTSC domain-containing protein [Anaerobaca lacustris]|uniref:KTSC domain-containing protein n=1 Tax=Anaerobaca lacustris TaxID=3044600 RepID=A0AAW6U7B1_9BACT|nr:KTSC domain-containing protein [Sedimentisphaerales bacterium M17dextr]